MQGGSAPLTLPHQPGLPSPSSCPQHMLQTPMERLLLESREQEPPSPHYTHTQNFSRASLGSSSLGRDPLPWCSLMQNSAPDYSQVLEDAEVRQAVWPC